MHLVFFDGGVAPDGEVLFELHMAGVGGVLICVDAVDPFVPVCVFDKDYQDLHSGAPELCGQMARLSPKSLSNCQNGMGSRSTVWRVRACHVLGWRVIASARWRSRRRTNRINSAAVNAAAAIASAIPACVSSPSDQV